MNWRRSRQIYHIIYINSKDRKNEEEWKKFVMNKHLVNLLRTKSRALQHQNADGWELIFAFN